MHRWDRSHDSFWATINKNVMAMFGASFSVACKKRYPLLPEERGNGFFILRKLTNYG